nr:revertase [dwarf hamster endogenous retrovirus MRS-Ps, Peptide, 213 aa] [Dwarf hamster endogenous retrovirus MRS-Ps]
LHQWPLTTEKIQAIEEIIQEQLQAGHLEESFSPWNKPIFVIRKKSGKWRLLPDLRAVNATMYDMGALQPGLPFPFAVPQGWKVIFIDLQYCFFMIPMHPDDCQRFAFSVPSVNYKEPFKRYQWRVLSQGMKNSPTLCQYFVAKAITIRDKYQGSYLMHYMDDILIAHPDIQELDKLFVKLINNLKDHGLVVAPDEVQQKCPINYLVTTMQEDY